MDFLEWMRDAEITPADLLEILEEIEEVNPDLICWDGMNATELKGIVFDGMDEDILTSIWSSMEADLYDE